MSAGAGSERLSPEVEFVLLAARATWPEDVVARAATIARGPAFDGQRLLELTGFHGLSSLACQLLAQGDLLADATDWRGVLLERQREQTARALLAEEDLRQVLERLSGAGVEVTVLKGPALAHWLYRSAASREYGDLDLVVHPIHVRRAGAELEGLGYRPRFRLPEGAVDLHQRISYELQFDRPGRTTVDLHWRPLGWEFGFLLADEPWPTRRQRVELGSGLELWTLGAEDCLVHLCAHGGKHCWERLRWIADVARLLTVEGGLDLAAAESVAARKGCRRLLALGLRLCAELLATPLSSAGRDLAWGDPALPALADQVLARLGLAEPTPKRTELTFPARARERRRDQLRWVAGVLLMPTAIELAEEQGRVGLSPGLAARRAWRLLRKHVGHRPGRGPD